MCWRHTVAVAVGGVMLGTGGLELRKNWEARTKGGFVGGEPRPPMHDTHTGAPNLPR